MDEVNYQTMSYREVCDYHDQMREALYKFIEEEYLDLGIKVSPITLKEAKQANSWKELWKNGKAAAWDWVDMFYDYQGRNGARRLDMAIWKNTQLLGLVYGMLDRDRLILKVHAMEANPEDNPIKGKMLTITLFAAEAYSELNNTKEIWLCTPVSNAHVKLYSQRGYTPFYDHWDRCTHLAKRLK